MDSQRVKLIAIVGPTASGKTQLAIDVAKKFDGEIICADSRTIYEGMDIGTAKPTKQERAEVMHHGLDLVSPDQSFSAAEFKDFTQKMVNQISSRGKIPILVGGSGLYLWAFLYNYSFPAGANSDYRKKLEEKDLAWLVEYLKEKDPLTRAVIDLKNKRRVIRAIETIGLLKTKKHSLPKGYRIIGLNPPMFELEARIATRTKKMLDQGLLEETAKIIGHYGNDIEILRTIGYAEVQQVINGSYNLVKAIEMINLHTRQLAKRQLTWFKRSSDIEWFEDTTKAWSFVCSWFD